VKGCTLRRTSSLGGGARRSPSGRSLAVATVERSLFLPKSLHIIDATGEAPDSVLELPDADGNNVLIDWDPNSDIDAPTPPQGGPEIEQSNRRRHVGPHARQWSEWGEIVEPSGRASDLRKGVGWRLAR
jgi:hypothetical protein